MYRIAAQRASARGLGLLLGSLLLVAPTACADLPTTVDMEGPPMEEPTGSSPGAASNALAGADFWVNPGSPAQRQVEAWRASRPADAAQLEKIASQPQAVWFGDWTPHPYAAVDELTTRIHARGELPVFVLYNIPQRDCGLYSAGGAGSDAAYREWVREVARGIGGRRAVVVLEPDALAGMDCLSAADQERRVALIREAVATLEGAGAVSLYLDAGNARWHAPAVIAERLLRAGLDRADGFALNVSNFLGNAESIAYGERIAERTGGKHFVIDTSRNGAGPAPDGAWCNPPGRALGTRPTTQTGHALVDAYLWIKAPGESDGECNGGPRAGEWWPEYALGLAQRATG